MGITIKIHLLQQQPYYDKPVVGLFVLKHNLNES